MNPSSFYASLLQGQDLKPWTGASYLLTLGHVASKLATTVQQVPLASTKWCKELLALKLHVLGDHNFLVKIIYNLANFYIKGE